MSNHSEPKEELIAAIDQFTFPTGTFNICPDEWNWYGSTRHEENMNVGPYFLKADLIDELKDIIEDQDLADTDHVLISHCQEPYYRLSEYFHSEVFFDNAQDQYLSDDYHGSENDYNPFDDISDELRVSFEDFIRKAIDHWQASVQITIRGHTFMNSRSDENISVGVLRNEGS